MCTQCSKPFGTSKDMAILAMVPHMKEQGIRPASPAAPDTTRGGRGWGGSASAFREGATDLMEGAVEGIGNALGKLFDP